MREESSLEPRIAQNEVTMTPIVETKAASINNFLRNKTPEPYQIRQDYNNQQQLLRDRDRSTLLRPTPPPFMLDKVLEPVDIDDLLDIRETNGKVVTRITNESYNLI